MWGLLVFWLVGSAVLLPKFYCGVGNAGKAGSAVFNQSDPNFRQHSKVIFDDCSYPAVFKILLKRRLILDYMLGVIGLPLILISLFYGGQFLYKKIFRKQYDHK